MCMCVWAVRCGWLELGAHITLTLPGHVEAMGSVGGVGRGGAGNYWEAIKHVEDMGGVGRSGGGGRALMGGCVMPIILWRIRVVWWVWSSGSRRQGGQGHLHAGG